MNDTHDIDLIIRGVRKALPAVTVTQMDRHFPADDDGLWWFRLPGVAKDIQIESSTYDCPFLVEHDDMRSTSDAIRAHTVDEAVAAVVSYLRSPSSARP